jgi:SAM-dependent methyltransferase
MLTMSGRNAPTTPTFHDAIAFYEEKTLDLDRWFQVADVDYLLLLSSLDFEALFPARRLRLLDVGCGTGRFPSLLRPWLNGVPTIEYDFLDPSPYCLQVMRECLVAPFEAGQALAMRAEELDVWRQQRAATYDIVWAIHSLYCGQVEDVPGIIRNLYGLLAPGVGVGLIYIATRRSFYLQLHDLYREVFASPMGYFLGADEYAAAFDASGLPWSEERLRFFHIVPLEDHRLLESYLHKCALDPSQPLSVWQRQDSLHDLIESCREGGFYRFPQEVALFRFGVPAAGAVKLLPKPQFLTNCTAGR